ncbi:hypothetical protein HYU20_00640 [Candidatus Woesearchaeota archaeon]|nr:hypothetical protein [Candidatus Woesearchaeota archaeon]
MVAIVSLKWCGKQPKGIKLVEPNENLAKEYIATAEETLGILKEIDGKSNVWLAATKYYLEYFAVYSLLMKLGIKSEIHECTIALCSFLEKEGLLPKGTYKLLAYDKQLRIDNQYYLKNRQVVVEYDSIVDFFLAIKSIAENVTLKQKEDIREKLEKSL